MFNLHNKFLRTISKSSLSFALKPIVDLPSDLNNKLRFTHTHTHTHTNKGLSKLLFYISSWSPTLMKNVSWYSSKIGRWEKYLVINGKKCRRLERNCLTRSFVFRSPQSVVLTEYRVWLSRGGWRWVGKPSRKRPLGRYRNRREYSVEIYLINWMRGKYGIKVALFDNNYCALVNMIIKWQVP